MDYIIIAILVFFGISSFFGLICGICERNDELPIKHYKFDDDLIS